MKPSKTEYRGGEALVFNTGAMEFVVTTAVGPRVVSLRSLAGEGRNVFLEFPASEKPFHGFMLRGGHRLWHAPEDIVRSYQPDNSPLGVKLLANGVALTQPTEEKTGVQKGMRLEVLADRTIKVTHTLTNRGMWAIDVAPWALTMFKPGGFAAIGLEPKGDHAKGDLLPTYALVPWTFTDLSLPVWKFGRNFIGVNVAAAKQAQKLGLTNYPGWAAYWIGGTTFVKYAKPVRGATYPDLGSCFEVFTNGKMIELETLGALAKLEPGKTATHVEHWTLFDDLPKPVTNQAVDGALAPAVAAWIRGL
ncbi:hypothetical protein K0B96_08195 [Horticoccus luteus]|uniref:Uncharacterized protein n=1 Tax=Horticoccus luteus TaxID=2862869 RepID=A0A8F9TYP0_9BACT|nr:hypothetical protein [Horticoccus luteus]QYM80570.1 hypothetical protein K0B96_08195 [Horticoccus luteus]